MRNFIANPKNWYRFGLVVIVFGIGYVAGWYFHTRIITANPATRENSAQYKYINPILLSDSGTEKPTPGLSDLVSTFSKTITTDKNNNQATDVSVYYRDLNSGNWTGINYDDQYAPGSMLKVAVLIAYMRVVELNPSILDDRITVSTRSQNLDTEQHYPPQNPIQAGKEYTNQQLISAMIIDSDNNAASLLSQEIGDFAVNDIYKELQMPVQNQGGTDYLSPRLYARLFRTLYNSSFLSHELSEKVLGLLSETTFTKGIVAGVPSGISVAHKFGEQTVTSPDGQSSYNELHDCGIVYYPDHPYVLCVMTKGTDYSQLEKVISDISKQTWKYVDDQYRY